jgi:DNA polymerase III delta subunit
MNQLTLIHGEERFLVDRSVSVWRDRARPPQLDVEVFDGPARLNEFRHAVAEMPLFDPERALLLRDPPQLTGSAKRGGIDPPERLVAILGELAPTTVLCMVAHAKVPDRNAVLAAVRARGGSIVFHAAVKGRDLRTWVEREIGDRPLSIGDVRVAVAGDEAAGLYDTLGELLGPTPAKGAESIDRLLAEGRAGQYLLAILAGQIRDLVLTQAYVQSHGSGAGLAAALGKPDWQADRLSRQARSVSPALAAGWLAALHDVDRKLKSGEIAETDGLRLAVLRAAAEVTAERGQRRR